MIIKSIHLKNFQAYKDATINFSNGFTCIVGSNDVGKSAILRALGWMLFGEPWKSSFIRFGATETTVTITAEKDSKELILTRTKGEKINQYKMKFDGKQEVFEDFGKDIPAPVTNITRMFPLVFDKDVSTNLNFSFQFDPLFLIQDSGALRAKILGKLTGVHIVDGAIRDVNADKKRINTEIGVIEENIELAKKNLEQYKGLEDKGKKLVRVRETIDRVSLSADKLGRLKGLYARGTEFKAKRESLLEKERVASVIDIETLSTLVLNNERLLILQGLLYKMNSIIEQEDIIQETGKTIDRFNIEETLEVVDKSSRLKLLREYQSAFEKNAGRVISLCRMEDENNYDFERAKEELRRLGKCPVCFTDLTSEKVEQIVREI